MKSRPMHAKPIFLEGGSTGVLLLHGFTATPQCLEYLATEFQKADFTVMAPLLAGHGTSYQDLEKTHWQDWHHSAERAFQELRATCRQVMVAGLSMGGLLTAHLAHHHPRSISALGFMATPIFLDGFLVKGWFPTVWKTPLKKFIRYQTKVIASIKDPQARRRYQTYHKVPVASVATLLELQRVVRQELKYIHLPTVIIHSLHDETVPYSNLEYTQAILASEEIKTVTLQKSNHVITVDYDKEIVARQLIRFFKKFRKN